MIESRNGIAQTVLEQRDRRGGAVRDRVGDVPGLLLVEDVPVLELLRAGERAGLRALLAGGAEADQRADERRRTPSPRPG